MPAPSAGAWAQATRSERTPVTSPAPPGSSSPALKAPPAARPGRSLELRIGQKAVGWVGAILVVFGAAFLVKLGFESKLWSSLGGPGKALVVAGLGLVLVAGGEVVLRRIGRAASVGLFGAGLGTLYLDAYATFKWFRIFETQGAFLLMALVAVGGFAITLRTRFRTIGVLTIVAGYLTPWLLRGGAAGVVVEVGAYLTALLVIATGLSAARRGEFRALRHVALGGHGVTGLMWVLDAAPADWITVLVFLSLWWVIVLAECVLAAARRQSAVGNVVATLLSTAWFVTIGAWVLASPIPAAGFNWRGLFTAAVGLIAGAVAFNFGPWPTQFSADGSTRGPRTARDRLAIALWAQMGVLVAVAVALHFEERYGRSVGWLAIGLASIEIGRRLKLRAIDIFGLIVGALGVASVVLIDSWVVTRTVVLNTGDIALTRWGVLVLCTVAAGHAAAQRLSLRWRVMPAALAWLASLGWLAVWVLESSGLTTTTLWLAAAAILIVGERLGRRQRFLGIGMLVLGATAVRWTAVDAIDGRLSPAWDASASMPFVNPQMILALAIASVAAIAARMLVRRGTARLTGAPGAPIPGAAGAEAGWQVILVLGIGVVLVGLCFEADRTVTAAARTFAFSLAQVRQLLVTMIWAGGSVGISLLARVLAAGSSRPPRLLWGVAWSLIVLCTLKWVGVDTLYFGAVAGSGRAVAAIPVLNLQMLIGVLLAAAALILTRLAPPFPDEAAQRAPGSIVWTDLRGVVPVAAAVMVLWGLTFEVDRALAWYEASRTLIWRAMELRGLWWTALWAAGGAAMIAVGRWRRSAALVHGGAVVGIGAGLAWVVIDTLGARAARGGPAPVPVILNLQFAVGALCAVLLAITAASLKGRIANALDPWWPKGARIAALALLAIVGLWLGGIEIDRFFDPAAGRFASAGMARQAGLSIYGAVYAIGLITLGFSRRVAPCRWAGLALLAVVLAKVLTVDMAEVRYVYRVLSFLGVGLLFVATSVGYARLASRVGEPAKVEE